MLMAANPLPHNKNDNGLRAALGAALPICLGYVPLGVACGMLGVKAGLLPIQVVLLSVFLYAGGGQFMIANLVAAGIAPLTIAVSVALLNARHILYAAALSKHIAGAPARRLIVFGAEVTDESFGVNQNLFMAGGWSLRLARMVNTIAHTCWTISNLMGALLVGVLALPLSVVAYTMTAMFICLLCMQAHTARTIRAAAVAAACVAACKLLGFPQIAVLAGSVLGVVSGMCGKKRGEVCDGMA
jgi:4-azaleucine resistance transporter AzlC